MPTEGREAPRWYLNLQSPSSQDFVDHMAMRTAGRRLRCRPRCTKLHPASEPGDVGIGQLLLRWHLGLVEILNGSNQQTLVHLSRHDRGAAVAAFQDRRVIGQLQAPAGFLGVMAGLASL